MFNQKDIGKVFYMPLAIEIEKNVFSTNLKSELIYSSKGLKSAFIASDGSKDRHNQTVNPEGWDLKYFMQNPAMLWAHKHDIPAIGMWENIRFSGKGAGKKLLMSPKYDMDDEFAASIARKVENGFIRMVSVGFIPLELDNEYNSVRQELLETSIVNIGANRNSLGVTELTAKQKKQEVKKISEDMMNYLLSK